LLKLTCDGTAAGVLQGYLLFQLRYLLFQSSHLCCQRVGWTSRRLAQEGERQMKRGSALLQACQVRLMSLDGPRQFIPGSIRLLHQAPELSHLERHILSDELAWHGRFLRIRAETRQGGKSLIKRRRCRLMSVYIVLRYILFLQ